VSKYYREVNGKQANLVLLEKHLDTASTSKALPIPVFGASLGTNVQTSDTKTSARLNASSLKNNETDV